MDASVGVLYMLWDLRLFVTDFSLSSGPWKGSDLQWWGRYLFCHSLLWPEGGKGVVPALVRGSGQGVARSLPGAFRAL